MSATVETSIWLALKSRIDTLAMSYPRAWPGEDFYPPSAGGMPAPYIRVGRSSAAPASVFLEDGKAHNRLGSIILTLVHPLGQNVAVYDEIAGNIAKHFKDGTHARFGNVCLTVTRFPHVQEGYEDNGYWTVPVVIPWRCFA